MVFFHDLPSLQPSSFLVYLMIESVARLNMNCLCVVMDPEDYLIAHACTSVSSSSSGPVMTDETHTLEFILWVEHKVCDPRNVVTVGGSYGENT